MVSATRTTLTPCLAQLLATLPCISQFVFASAGKFERIPDIRTSHSKALTERLHLGANYPRLRRSFSLLVKAAGAPAGEIAQGMRHKLGATPEV